MKYLELAGSFKKGPEWDNIRDSQGGRGYISHDLRILPIPFIEDSTYDGVYNEHFIEHLTKEEGIEIFKEMLRIMKPGAVIRTVWPSMDFIDRLTNNPNSNDLKFTELYHKFIIDRENVFNKPYYRSYGGKSHFDKMTKAQRVAFRMQHQEGEHKHLWYVQEMIDTMKELGFKDVREEQYQVSRLHAFNGIDNPQEMRPLHSTIVEAIK